MRVVVGALATACFVLASTTTASAWYARGAMYAAGAGTVQVYAEPGEQNNLTAEKRPLSVTALGMKAVRLHDPDNPVTRTDADRPGCVVVDAHTLDCNGVHFTGEGEVSVTFVEPSLGDGDDRFYVPTTSGPLGKVIDAGAGDDTIVAKDLGGAHASLGDGNDTISLRGGGGAGWHPIEDVIHAGPGDDVLRLVNAQDDNPYCAEGTDVLYADVGEASDGACETVHTFP